MKQHIHQKPAAGKRGSALRDIAAVSAAFARPEPPAYFPDPCSDDNFLVHCVGEPTREEIALNCMAVALRGQVKDGLISEAKADRKLWLFMAELEASPFAPDFDILL